MTPLRSRVAATVATTLALLTALLASPGSAVPIPQDPGADSVVPFLGEPREARPIPDARFAPRHPFMAGNGRSNLHDDAYQSDAGPTPGPLGFSPEVVSTMFTQECASLTFDKEGRLLTVCVGVETVDLRMLDPETLDVLAEFPLPPRAPSAEPFSSFGGGGYFYLDHRDRVVVPTSTGQIYVVADTGTPDAPVLTLQDQYDVSEQADGSPILSALPDWDGRIWFVTASGVVGTVNQKTGTVRGRDLGEPIGNSVAVDETGGVFIVSDEALYRFDANRKGGPSVTWRKKYDGGTRQKPGQTQTGSGTTPTIIKRRNHRYVAITDNADPRMHVLVFRAGRAGPGRAPLCRVPVFAKDRSATDNSLIAFGRSIVVENNYGYSGPREVPPSGPQRGTPTTEPGVTRIVVDYRHGADVELVVPLRNDGPLTVRITAVGTGAGPRPLLDVRAAGGLPVVLAPGDRHDLVVSGALGNCAYHHERQVQNVDGLQLDVEVLGRPTALQVPLDSPLLVHSPMIVGCPDRTLTRNDDRRTPDPQEL